MKRDPDLIRKLLIFWESKESTGGSRDICIEGYSNIEIMYHLVLMDDAGFLYCERTCSSTTPDRVINVTPFHLTWKGHEFLDAARNENNWNSVKSTVLNKTGSLSFEVIKQVLNKSALSSLGL
ncbi:DUF2513 domain-containing protein [Endozoicomonas sp. G2_1]|uniref:DUF2513 domain-containing protein n=1 Tax=Endozoicomonas sp. G2_1 TaxID=2821091 RepID=UPI001ADB19AD|nr:DUF2513 domain-containing protein [Endozoicomonas sp. G2_1]MBO9491824.1 DUF2513 domain-containing protein [Endozoicomonas sp. G2_1]